MESKVFFGGLVKGCIAFVYTIFTLWMIGSPAELFGNWPHGYRWLLLFMAINAGALDLVDSIFSKMATRGMPTRIMYLYFALTFVPYAISVAMSTVWMFRSGIIDIIIWGLEVIIICATELHCIQNFLSRTSIRTNGFKTKKMLMKEEAEKAANGFESVSTDF